MARTRRVRRSRRGLVGEPASARAQLVRLLQDAHAGELAAALAYRGHWHSLRRATERAEVKRIEGTEWHHRGQVLTMLELLHERPRRPREFAMWSIGRFFGALCFVGGWFAPMYAAGRLEAMNVGQYLTARELADELGLAQWVPPLEAMRVEEGRHEQWFGDRVRGHWLLRPTRYFLKWNPPDPLSDAA